MDFAETEEHALIRDAVRKVCADFPDAVLVEARPGARVSLGIL